MAVDIPRALRDIDCRTRIVFGSADILGAFSAPRYAAAIPGAELVELPGCGHMPMADAPDLVAQTILDVTTRATTKT
jgi:pimeloyl-ACP methyl ester carboxylesterase